MLGRIDTETGESDADQVGEEVGNSLLHVLLLGGEVDKAREVARVEVDGVGPGVEGLLAVEV